MYVHAAAVFWSVSSVAVLSRLNMVSPGLLAVDQLDLGLVCLVRCCPVLSLLV